MTRKTVTRTTNEVAQRLREWRSVHLTQVGALCDDAAKEIDRLQKVIDDYVYIAKASAKEIKQLRKGAIHGAAPAATARTDADRNRSDKAAFRLGTGAGNTHPMQTTPGECSEPREGTEPVAWALICGDFVDSTFTDRDEAVEWAGGIIPPPQIVPLYRRPSLTDAEREAVLDAALAYESDPDEWECAKIAATLRGLLERMK